VKSNAQVLRRYNRWTIAGRLKALLGDHQRLTPTSTTSNNYHRRTSTPRNSLGGGGGRRHGHSHVSQQYHHPLQHCECIRVGACMSFDSPERGGSHQQALLTEQLQGADGSGGVGGVGGNIW
jgi:hypothetical protein